MAYSRRSLLAAAAAGAAGIRPIPALGRAEQPRVILIRYGGGVRPREVLDPEASLSPFVRSRLAPAALVLPQVMIPREKDAMPGHGHGTVTLICGQYGPLEDIEQAFLRSRFDPPAATLFERLRARHSLPAHQVLVINGEDRPDEDLITWSGHGIGVAFRAETLSLNRWRIWLGRRQIAEGRVPDPAAAEALIRRGQQQDWRPEDDALPPDPAIERFWAGMRAEYGDSLRTQPRGDRLLTALALRAMAELKPRLMMVNYQDPDYVHFGIASQYRRAIAIIDEGIRLIHAAIQADREYRDRTILVLCPDCGRDDNPYQAVPFQHHSDTAAARQIFALFHGPGIRPGLLDRSIEQAAIPASIGRLLDLPVGDMQAPPVDALWD